MQSVFSRFRQVGAVEAPARLASSQVARGLKKGTLENEERFDPQCGQSALACKPALAITSSAQQKTPTLSPHQRNQWED